jgi:hypothetical protein
MSQAGTRRTGFCPEGVRERESRDGDWFMKNGNLEDGKTRMRVCETTALTGRGHERLMGRSYSLQIPKTARKAAGEVGPRIGAATGKQPREIRVIINGVGHKPANTSVTTAAGNSRGSCGAGASGSSSRSWQHESG